MLTFVTIYAIVPGKWSIRINGNVSFWYLPDRIIPACRQAGIHRHT